MQFKVTYAVNAHIKLRLNILLASHLTIMIYFQLFAEEQKAVAALESARVNAALTTDFEQCWLVYGIQNSLDDTVMTVEFGRCVQCRSDAYA